MTGLRSVPRAPGRRPLLGHALPLWRDPLPFLTSLKDSGDLVRVDLGPLPIYVVTSEDLTHELLVTQGRHFHKGRFFDRARILVGDGIATASGDVHRRHRRLMQPAFHRDRINDYITTMSARAHAMSAAWQPGQTVAVDTALYEYAMTTLVESMFAAEISPSVVDAVRRDIPILIKTALTRAASPTILDGLPIPANRRFDTAAGRLRRVVADLITQARSATTHGPNLLSTLLAARDADTGEPLSDTEILDELVTLLFAGTETTASTLAWAYHDIARHPDIETRLCAEIDTVIGSAPITPQALARLPYTHRVLTEVARLHSIPLLMRRAADTVTLGGIEIPPGTELGFSLYALHQHPDLYPDPTRFDPDRWLPNAPATHRRFIPFGAGTRKCIGDNYAWTAMLVNLATTLAHWRLHPAPGHTVREVAAAVAHPDALPMLPTVRGSSAGHRRVPRSADPSPGGSR